VSAAAANGLFRVVENIREAVHLRRDPATGEITAEVASAGVPGAALHGVLPPVYPEWLGDRSFQEDHGTRFAYAAGAMANGIATAALVTALANHGLLGFFGAAGLPYARIVEGLDAIAGRLADPGSPWGANLIHAPQEPELEWRTARLYVERGVRFVEASAFLALTPAVVYAACRGLALDGGGQVVRPRALFAKVSRPEVARRFLAPAPSDLLQGLRDAGHLTPEEVSLAARVPLATDVTVEADSGGHTDNRPLAVLVPLLLALRAEVAREFALASPPRLGAAGGLGTPAAVASALALGADYVVTGTVNQSAVEAGLSEDGKRLLAQADVADVAMAAAADMFEMGVKVQVLRRGTLFAARANRLFEVYRQHEGLDQIPPAVRSEIEEKVLGASFDAVWRETESYWTARDPAQVARAHEDPKHHMALVFRWYLGMSSRWAIAGEARRRADYQIWCGPAMGAFNDWARGSFLADPAQRTVEQIAFNLLEGAAVVTRAQALRAAGVSVPAEAFGFRPRRLRLG
jgi:trans-AT polyketide synthase/acyltransferase/oxidoreductase domain-containing protein